MCLSSGDRINWQTKQTTRLAGCSLFPLADFLLYRALIDKFTFPVFPRLRLFPRYGQEGWPFLPPLITLYCRPSFPQSPAKEEGVGKEKAHSDITASGLSPPLFPLGRK